MRVLAATNNSAKLAELRAMLAPHGWEVVAQSEFDLKSVNETGATFVENALLKARNACEHSGLPAIADDSGLEVDALRGAPGIYSARYAGDNATDADNIQKLLKDLAATEFESNSETRTARFHCTLVYMRYPTDPSPLISIGTWEGQIAITPTGNNGFGYDPIFFLDDLGKTSAQLNPAEKNRLSHRGQALNQLLSQLTTRHEQAL